MRCARFAATMSVLALLAGCATDPRGGYTGCDQFGKNFLSFGIPTLACGSVPWLLYGAGMPPNSSEYGRVSL